ncbi:MAG: hypothetical protein ACPG4U_04045 [Pseudomonadales bacterium]
MHFSSAGGASESPPSAAPENQANELQQIAAHYDMHSISPREVDQLIHALKESKEFSWQELAMLETKGEAFLCHTGDSPRPQARAVEKTDLIQSVECNIQFNRLRRAPSRTSEELLSLIRKIDAARSC